MRYGLLATAAITLLTTSVIELHAQQTIPSSSDSLKLAEKSMGSILKGMTLSNTQKDSIYVAWKRFGPMFDQIANEGGGVKITSDRILAVIEQRRTAIRRHLKPDQQAIFDKNVKENTKRNEAVYRQAVDMEAKQSNK